MITLQNHYERLKEVDLERWSAMNGQLVSKPFPNKSDCLTYWKRTILQREKPDLTVIPGWIQKQMVDFLGFTWDDIWANRIPPLPEPQP